MKQHVAIVIAALMITSMAFAISTTSVSATHERTASIDKNIVKGNTQMIRTITITNTGPDAIDNVRIIVPSSFTGRAFTIKIPKDNIVTLENGNENIVTLPAGTLITLASGTGIKAVENTLVTIPSGTKIRWIPAGTSDNQDAVLQENLSAKIYPDNLNFNTGTDNANTVEDIVVTVDNGTARLLADTRVVRVSGNVVRLPGNTTVQLVGNTTAGLGADNKVTLESKKSAEPDTINPSSDNTGTIFVALATADTSLDYDVSIGDNVLVWATGGTDNKVVFSAGTELVLTVTNNVTIFENTNVTRAANENVKMTSATAAAAENEPKNWTQATGTSVLPSGPYFEWEGIGENQIASGGSLDFPLAFTSPGGGNYTIYVRTKDTAGVVVQTTITLTVDNVPPTVEVAASPSWTKGNTAVTITVTADEPLAKLDNVMVAENNAPENTQVTMTPNADKTVWTGTYTTGDNENRDGTATIYVIGSQYEDLNGNAGSGVDTKTFTVDRRAPTTPDLSAIIGFPTPPTNIATWFIENEAMDNFLGSLVPLEGGTVKIRVGTTVYNLTPTATGYYSKSITLTEGIQEVGIQYIDKAGNVGTENAENMILDTMGPFITWGTIASKALVDGVRINDATPTITLTIADLGMGIENAGFNSGDNSGYRVDLQYENGSTMATLVNATLPTESMPNTISFENTYPTTLTENTYRIYVVAGDNIQMENAVITFVVDVTAPTMPGLNDVTNPVLDGTTGIAPKVQRNETLVLYGSGVEGSSTVKIYLIDQATGSAISTATTTADATGNFSKSVTLSEGKIVRIEVETIDAAGNVSSRPIYGYAMADATAPSVTLATPPETTDKTSITISGTVSKDAWEDWSDITLTVQVGTGRVVVPIGAGGSYNYSLALSEGPNTIVVQASDSIGNASAAVSATVERTVTPWMTYAIVLVIIALLMAVIAIFRK